MLRRLSSLTADYADLGKLRESTKEKLRIKKRRVILNSYFLLGRRAGQQRSTTVGGSTATRRFSFNFLGSGNIRIGFEMVIVKQFLARSDVAQGVDENSTPGFADFAIGIARMVDEPRFVSLNRGVDHPFAVADREKIHSRVV